jgi:hypothetical protein
MHEKAKSISGGETPLACEDQCGIGVLLSELNFSAQGVEHRARTRNLAREGSERI